MDKEKPLAQRRSMAARQLPATTYGYNSSHQPNGLEMWPEYDGFILELEAQTVDSGSRLSLLLQQIQHNCPSFSIFQLPEEVPEENSERVLENSVGLGRIMLESPEKQGCF